MRTKARSVLVFAFDEVEVLDIAGPLQVLALAGRRWNFRPYKVQVCAPRQGLVETRNQLRIEAVSTLKDAPPSEIVLVPGGYGARRLTSEPAIAVELARVGASAELVAGVGWGVALLGRAGLLGAARVAASPDIRDVLSEYAPGAVVDLEHSLIGDGRVLTGRSTGTALDLALAIVDRTLGPKLVSQVQSELGLPHERIHVSYGRPQS